MHSFVERWGINLLPVTLFVLWVLTLVFLRKINMHFFVFLAGSIGMFCFAMYIGMAVVGKFLEYSVTWLIWLIGDTAGLYNAYPDYSMITAYHAGQAVSFFVDYECSGFIETLVYVCLLLFYPVYKLGKKAVLTVIGIGYVFIANVFRVFVICMITKFSGSTLFFFSHTIFARVLFFILMVIIYYVVFTRPHILKQRTGNLIYGKQ